MYTIQATKNNLNQLVYSQWIRISFLHIWEAEQTQCSPRLIVQAKEWLPKGQATEFQEETTRLEYGAATSWFHGSGVFSNKCSSFFMGRMETRGSDRKGDSTNTLESTGHTDGQMWGTQGGKV